MKIIRTVKAMQAWSGRVRQTHQTIGFIPTMGALHEGHLSLVRAASRESDHVVVSIFVNPAQFGPREDFHRYPRPFARDRKMAARAGVDVLFTPSVKDIYPTEDGTTVEPPPALVNRLCGLSRPGHFRGVATVVAKLFHAVGPHQAYFGQKDAQQCAVIQRLVKDLRLPVGMRIRPIVRESDGLAMSSRNVYLNVEERKAARVLSRALQDARRQAGRGLASGRAVNAHVKRVLRGEPLVRVEYAETVNPVTLEPVVRLKGRVMVILAVHIGRTRLIDNAVFSV